MPGRSTTPPRQPALPPGHNYRYRIAVTDGPGTVSAWSTTSAFTPREAPENSSAITYSGSWTRASNTAAVGGYTKYTTTTGAAAAYTTTARAIAWGTLVTAASGNAKIYVDGVLQTTVDLDSTYGTYRYVMYTISWPTSDTHTVKVVNAGSARVDVDAFARSPSNDSDRAQTDAQVGPWDFAKCHDCRRSWRAWTQLWMRLGGTALFGPGVTLR
jgi:hypothetical protein